MQYTPTYELPYYTDQEIRSKIDILLEANAKDQATLGTESEKEERKRLHEVWMERAKEIKKLDPKFYSRIWAQNY